MKIAHFSDLHYCLEHLEEVDRCFGYAVERAIDAGVDCAVISGDLFDHRLELHEPAVDRLLTRVVHLADRMPVLILQGTFSHDFPGSLDVFKTLGGEYPVYVADRIQQVALMPRCGDWRPSADFSFTDLIIGAKPYAIFSCMPPVHKGAIAASAGAEKAATAAGELVHDLMKGWSVINDQANKAGIHTVVVSHGTVNNCITEHGVPMHGLDHEFTTGSLYASKARAVMLGHIHQHQHWTDIEGSIGANCIIAYPGSIGRLHFGEVNDKGFLIWDLAEMPGPVRPAIEFITTPAKRLMQIEFDGPPDMVNLQKEAESCNNAHVRIRYQVDEADKDSIDKAAIEQLFAAAAEVKIEGRIKPIQRQRAAGITQATGINAKLTDWGKATGLDNETGEAAQERLRMLETMEPGAIAAETTERLAKNASVLRHE